LKNKNTRWLVNEIPSGFKILLTIVPLKRNQEMKKIFNGTMRKQRAFFRKIRLLPLAKAGA